ncbi:MAG: hypothetical protein Q4A66_12330, partial [Eubacteriales bacterium]|nr:hypothetical protein [Eubacteriales bacterium]
MVANHPTTEDGKTVYAFSYTDSFSEWTQMRAAFTYESLVNPWTLSGYLYSEGLDDNVLYNGYTNTERSTYWQEMRFANKLWNMGLLDPDSFTQTGAERTEKMNNGQYAGAATGDGKAYNAAANPESTSAMIIDPTEAEMFFANKIHKAGYYPDQQV